MSEQKMIIVNEECDFIVENYEAIQALKKCEERAKERVPQWMGKKLKQILHSKLDGKWQIDEEEDEDGYYDDLVNETYYKKEDEVGYYFHIGNLTLEEFAADHEDDGCWVCLYCNFSTKRKQQWKDWNKKVKATIKENESEIIHLGYKVFPDDEDKSALVAMWLLNDLNIKALAKYPEKSIEKTADNVIEFVNNMSKYLVALPEE